MSQQSRRTRRQPPSRLRYAADHPTIAIHCDRTTYERLTALKEQSGQSLGNLVKQALAMVEKNIGGVHARGYAQGMKKGIAEGRAQGYAEGQARYCLTFECHVCGRPIEITVGSDPAIVAARALRDGGWGHRECHRLVIQR